MPLVSTFDPQSSGPTLSANAASAASLAARINAVYLTAARVYLAPAVELGA